MSRRRYDTDGVALPDDPTPELPLALPGLIEPHAFHGRLTWQVGLAEGVAAGPGRVAQPTRSDEFHALDLAEVDHELVRSDSAPEVIITPPPLGSTGRSKDEDGEYEMLNTGDLPRFVPPPTPPTRINGPGAAAEAENPDEVDNLMSEILAAEDTPSIRKTTSNWWSEIFDGTYIRLLPETNHRRTLREVEFLVRALRPADGGRILDVACGNGRHAVELADRGYDVVGLDMARPLLERAFSDADGRGLEPELLLGDMREMTFEQEFDGVFCWDTSFGFFDEPTNFAVLEGMSRALKPGANLVIEQVNRDHIVQFCPRRLWWERGELVIMEDITFDHRTSRLLVERQIADPGRPPWEQLISIRLYSPHELLSMTASAGLEAVDVTGDIAHPGSYLGAENRTVVITARRPS